MNIHHIYFDFSRNLQAELNAVKTTSIVDKSTQISNFNNLEDAFKFYDDSLLLLGEPGIGKSFLLKEFQQTIKEENPGGLVIFLQIWTWSNQKLPILDWIAQQTSYSSELLQQKIQAQQIIFIFDGLDELPYNISKLPEDPNSEKLDYRLEFMEEFSLFNQQFTGIKSLVSCRIQDYQDITNNNNIKINLNGAVKLKALQNQDIQKYINKALDNESQISQTLWNLLRKNRGLRKMVSNPLLLNIFVETCQSTQDIDKVATIGNIGELFNSFLDKTYQRLEKRHWETHGENLSLSLDEIKNLLGRVAIAMMGDLFPDDNEIYGHIVELVIQRYYKGKNLIFNQETTQQRIEELITISQQLNLTISTNKNPVTYSFRHLVLRDYFVINFLQKEIDTISTETKIEAARALAKINHIKASELLITLLEDQSKDTNICYEAVNSIAELNDGVDFRGYIQDFPQHTISSQISEFNIDNIKEYFNKFAEDRKKITDAEAEKLKQLTFGNPLAVKMLANMWRDGVARDTIFNHPEAPILTKNKRRLVAELFLNRCLNDEDKQAVYALAIMRRPEKELLRIILKAEDNTELYSRLQELNRRYSFVLPDEFKLEEQYKVFIQEYLLEPEQRLTPEILDLNRRARNYFQQNLDELIQKLNIKQQLESQKVTQTISNLIHHWQWRNEKEYDENFVWNDTKLTEYLIAGWQYNINWARNLLQDATVFTSTREHKLRWQIFKRGLASEATIDDKYSLLKYLETEINPQEISPTMVILLLKHGEILSRQQRTQEAADKLNEALIQAETLSLQDLIPQIQDLLSKLKPDTNPNESDYSDTNLNHSDYITSICINADGTKALSGSFDKTLKLWEASPQNHFLSCLLTFTGHTEAIYSVDVNCDRELAVSGSADKTVKLWNLQTGDCIQTFEGHTDTVTSVILSQDNGLIISGSFDKTVKIWNLVTGKSISTLEEHQDTIRSLALSTDAKLLLSASFDSTLKLWDIATGDCLRTFVGHSAEIHSVCFSSDGKFALSGGFDRTLKYWDINTGECLNTLKEDADVYSVALSNDNRFAISGNGNGTLKVWDIKTGECVQELEQHADVISSIALIPVSTPNNYHVISASGDETIQFTQLDLPPNEIEQPSVVKPPITGDDDNNYDWKLLALIPITILILSLIFWIWSVIFSGKDKIASFNCDTEIAKAQAAIQNYKYERKKSENINPNTIVEFKQTLDELEKTYKDNQQPNCLKENLGQMLQIYAVDIQASSGNVQGAIKNLRRVPSTYSKIEDVKKQIKKWETSN